MSDNLNVLTFNMLHKEFMMKDRVQMLARKINDLNLDIVLLQEVPFDKHGASETLDYLVSETGLEVAAINHHFIHKNYDSGSAILSRFPVIEGGKTLAPEDEGAHHYDSAYAVIDTPNRPVIVFTIHAAWGCENEVYRERQVLFLDRQAKELETKYSERNPFSIMGGDMNAESENNCIRFLTGKGSLDNAGTLWVDAWKYLHPEEAGYTVVPANKLATKTALEVGITRPELIPSRRIDYLMVRGWVYGRAGCPLEVKLELQDEDKNGYTASDHFGILTTLWNPDSFSA